MYRKYDQNIIEAIVRTKNVNLFPELGIPRTTANYWIKNSHKFGQLQTRGSLKNRLYKEHSENELLKSLLKLFINQDIFLALKTLKQRKSFVEIFESFSPIINKTRVLKQLGLNHSRYQRLKIEHLGCSKHHRACDPTRPKDKRKILPTEFSNYVQANRKKRVKLRAEYFRSCQFSFD